jgi:hypothetical protein
MLPELVVRNVRKMFPDGVDGAAAMRSCEVESVRQLLPVCPPCPASYVAGSGPYEYTVHVEQDAADLDLHLES